jgi:phosphotransferase system  glucose/maltose/N-acetylglucosamine-specific IIC component
VNPVSVLWFWRGLKGHSVTFAALFASLVLGLSISGGVYRLLTALGVHWLYVLILPTVLFSWTNRREPQWLPDVRTRRLIARSLLLGSLALAVAIAWLRPAPRADDARTRPVAQSTGALHP